MSDATLALSEIGGSSSSPWSHVPAVTSTSVIAGDRRSRFRSLAITTRVPLDDRRVFSYGGELRDGWALRKPMQLVLERDSDGWYVISDDLFFVYGLGPDLGAAFADYGQSLIEFYCLTERSVLRNEFDQPLMLALRSYIAQPTQPEARDAPEG